MHRIININSLWFRKEKIKDNLRSNGKKEVRAQHKSEPLGSSHNQGQYLKNKEDVHREEGQENKSWELESRRR